MKSVARNATIFTLFCGSYWMGALTVDSLLHLPSAAPPPQSPMVAERMFDGNMFEGELAPAVLENSLAIGLKSR